jgi:triosephosphate isomerase (TIM)
VRNIPVLCGAGIKDRRDVAIAMKLGASGIIIATHVVETKNPELALKELVKGTKEQAGK